MTNRILNVGLVSVLMIILIQMIAVLYELSGVENIYMRNSMNGMNSVLNTLVLINLWNVLVKFHKQIQLDYILKSMIVVFTIASFFSLRIGLGKIGDILLIGLSLINVILYIVFIHRLMEIDKSEINQIEQLKNYGLAFVISLFGQFMLSVVIELSRLKSLIFINHFLVIIPMIFLGLFFLKTKNKIRQK